MFREIFQYREMIFSLVKRDLRSRYKGSVLGFLWTFINPLLQLLVYTMVFSIIMRSGIKDYYMFLFVALVPWIFFSTSLTGGSSCIIAQQDMVKKIYFPREVLPIAHVTSQFINMLFCFIVIFSVLIIGGYQLHFKALLCLPVVMTVEYILALGITMVVAAVTVYLRDVEYSWYSYDGMAVFDTGHVWCGYGSCAATENILSKSYDTDYRCVPKDFI